MSRCSGARSRAWRTRRWGAACALVAAPMLCAARSGPVDRDGDQIPDHADPFPDDPDRPGRAQPGALYANTETSLHRIEQGGEFPRTIGTFTFSDARRHSVTDIAIDSYGVLYAVSFDALWVCEPATARCERLYSLLRSYNSLTMIRGADGAPDRLFAITTDGTMSWLDREQGALPAGALGGPSSGDVTWLGPGRLLASRDGVGGADELVSLSVDPPAVQGARAAPGSTIYGLARCGADTWALDADGSIYLSPGGGPFERMAESRLQWWGAACSPMQLARAPAVPGPEAPRQELPREAPEPEPPEDAPRVGCACR